MLQTPYADAWVTPDTFTQPLPCFWSNMWLQQLKSRMKRFTENEAIQMNANQQQFPVVLFIVYKFVLTFESVGEILTCDHLYDSYWAVRSCGAASYAV